MTVLRVFYNLDGEWDVENEGMAPDVELDMAPKLVNQSHDPPLEEGVKKAHSIAEKLFHQQSLFIHRIQPIAFNQCNDLLGKIF